MPLSDAEQLRLIVKDMTEVLDRMPQADYPPLYTDRIEFSHEQNADTLNFRWRHPTFGLGLDLSTNSIPVEGLPEPRLIGAGFERFGEIFPVVADDFEDFNNSLPADAPKAIRDIATQIAVIVERYPVFREASIKWQEAVHGGRYLGSPHLLSSNADGIDIQVPVHVSDDLAATVREEDPDFAGILENGQPILTIRFGDEEPRLAPNNSNIVGAQVVFEHYRSLIADNRVFFVETFVEQHEQVGENTKEVIEASRDPLVPLVGAGDVKIRSSHEYKQDKGGDQKKLSPPLKIRAPGERKLAQKKGRTIH